MIPIRDAKTSGRFPFWVTVIVAVNLYVFYKEVTSADLEVFIDNYALIPAGISLFDPHSLLTFFSSQFLHGGLFHLISNMWFLWIFGDNVEENLGFFLFPLFYLLSGFAGALIQYLIFPSSPIPMLGASGAIAGVMGAYLVLFADHKIETLIPFFIFPLIIDVPASFMLIYWFITQIISSLVSISIAYNTISVVAYFAHIGGFAFGLFVGNSLKNRQQNLPA